MTRLRALNESSSDDSDEENEEKETIEAQEERAFSLYKKALELQQQGKYPEAEHLLLALLNDDFLSNVHTENQPNGPDGLARPATALKYACLKNLGSILVLQDRAEHGLKCFIQAVELDESDVTMWHQMGTVALKVDNFELASQAFQEGLRCNNLHWPCLDSLLPVLYALDDYLGCLLLVSRTLQLDPDYHQALALRYQISKEHPSLLQSFKDFFPDENDILDMSSILSKEELSEFLTNAISLKERYHTKNTHHWSNVSCDLESNKITVTLHNNTWECLGKILLQTYKSVIPAKNLSYLHLVKILSPESIKSTSADTCDDQLLPSNTASSSAAELETEPMDADSEQDAKGEDQTEEDATEASGLEQDEEVKATNSVQENSSTSKRKRKRASLALMDQWSKRRSGRRSGRKFEEREESNLASCFRSILPISLLPKDLEAEIARASKRRSLRDPVELLAWGDDSMDTVELCRLLQERDAKDEHQRKLGQCSEDNSALQVSQENYFGTEMEHVSVVSFVNNQGSGSKNIIELLVEFVNQVSQKESLTWPNGMVPIYIEVYECMRTHVPYSSPVDGVGFTQVNLLSFIASLLYCELFVDLLQQNNQKNKYILKDQGVVFAEALGNVMLLSGLTHIFSTPAEHCKMMIRIHWLKVHLHLTQENSSLAINSLQDVLDCLDTAENIDVGQRKVMSDGLVLETKSDVNMENFDLFVEFNSQNKEASLDGILKETVPESGHSKEEKDTNSDEANDLTDKTHLTRQSANCPEDFNLGVQGSACVKNLDGILNDSPSTSNMDFQSHDRKETQKLQPSEGQCLELELNPSHTIPVEVHSESKLEEKCSEKPIIQTLMKESEAAAKVASIEKLDNLAPSLTKNGKQEEPFMDLSDTNKVVCVKEGKVTSPEDISKLSEIDIEQNYCIPTSCDVISNVCSEVEDIDVCKNERMSVDEGTLIPKQSNLPNNEEKIGKGEETVRKEITSSEDCVSNTIETTVIQIDKLKLVTESNTDLTSPLEEAEQMQSTNVPISSSASTLKIGASTPHTSSTLSNNIKETLDDFKSTSHDSAVKSYYHIILCNSRMNETINKRTAQKLLLSLSRQQQLSEVDDLYRKGQYDILASTLTECFKYCAQQVDIENPELESLPDRPTQMAMLLDSLWQLKKYSDCFYWTEACLHEAFNRYLNSADSDNSPQEEDDQQTWATTVERLLGGLNGCLKIAGLKLLEKLPKTCLTRLVQTLTSMLCQQLEQSDCSVEMAIECTTPWVLLHRVVNFEEQMPPKCQDSIPSHISILLTAHECMAKRSRCCLNEGILLNLILDVVVPLIRCPELSRFGIKLSHEIEQAIFCLYGHPKRGFDRNKKKLQDHKVHQHLELTWERSLTLLRFYEPDELPTFDVSSSKISPDEEQLFLRIVQLVPEAINPSQYLSKIKAFVNGSVGTFPDVQCQFPETACNLYYLLADYYLKTFKWQAAIKFYMLDVCLNPNRFDSWAGMALSRATLLTQEINSCNTLKNDVQLLCKTKAQQCFQKAVDLEIENTTMWIEYGNFAYTVHSFCSRLLKTETDSLSMEMFTKVEEEKDKMLALTEKCFKTAEKFGQDERWLQQYMLGKVAEKRGEGPVVFLQHYRAAAKLLHESNAEYPLVLSYDHSTQPYAFEAHEVYYRIHASILKSLESMEGKALSPEVENLYEETLNEASCSPFMAARFQSRLSITNAGNQFNSAKRHTVDVAEISVKKLKLDETAAINIIENDDTKALKSESVGIDHQANISSKNTSMREDNVTNQDVSASDLRQPNATKVKCGENAIDSEYASLVDDKLAFNVADKSTQNLDVSCHSKLVQEGSGKHLENRESHVAANVPEVQTDTDCEQTQAAVNSLPEEKEDLTLTISSKITENLYVSDSKQESVCEKGFKNGSSSTCAVDNTKRKISLINVNVENKKLDNNSLTYCNFVGLVDILPGLSVGGVDFSSDKFMHVNMSVVKEHDYAAPCTGAVHKPTQCESHGNRLTRNEDDGGGLKVRNSGRIFQSQKIGEQATSQPNLGVCTEFGKGDKTGEVKIDALLPLNQSSNLNTAGHFTVDLKNYKAHSKDFVENNLSGEQCFSPLLKKKETMHSMCWEKDKNSFSVKTLFDGTTISGSAKSLSDAEGSAQANKKNLASNNSTDISGTSTSSSSLSSHDSSDEYEDVDVNKEKSVPLKQNATKDSSNELLADLSNEMNQVNPDKSLSVIELKPDSVVRVQTDNLKSMCDSVQDPATKLNSAKEPKTVAIPAQHPSEKSSSNGSSLDHIGFVNRCLAAMDECLVRYPRHFKSFYRLCHYYFHSKQHRNLKKCRQLLLGDYRVVRVNKSINGLFKSASINSMFNDVWRMPVEEIDRAGSFASHMSRCVLLLMELLGAIRDHAFLLKLSVFLKREPEKKDKKYLRDNERVDLSKQALVMCLAALRQSVNQTRTADNVIEVYRTVKEGVKELPQKEGIFKGLLSDAFKKVKGLTQMDSSMYETAIEFCQNELNLRKAAAEAKTVQAHAQVQAQVQAQVHQQALQMGVGMMNPALQFSTLTSRFPSGVSTPPVRNPVGNPIFLPNMPVYRGRGRPPKAAQQRLQNAMMNMAHMISLGNAVSQEQRLLDSSKAKIKQQQKQQRPLQQQVTSSASPSPAVSSLIKDRPAISITTLPTNKSGSQLHNSAMGTLTASNVRKRTDSPLPRSTMSNVDLGQRWPMRPQHNFPRYESLNLPGATDPRGILQATGISGMSATIKNPRFKSVKKTAPSSTSTAHGFYHQPPRPYVPQQSAGTRMENPAALLSRLPELQVKQRHQSTTSHQQGFGSYPEQTKAQKSKNREPLSAKPRPPSLDRLQNPQMSNSQSSKPAISISKVSGSNTLSVSGISSTDMPEPKKIGDPNFDVITLD